MNSAHTAVFLVIGLIVLIICLIGIIIYFHDYKHYNYDYDPKWSYMLQELAEEKMWTVAMTQARPKNI